MMNKQLLPHMLKGLIIYDDELGVMVSKSSPEDMDWHQAIDYASKLTIGGMSGWRLPTKEEAESLAAKYSWFRGCWTSTEHASYSDYAWRVHFYTGYVYLGNKGYSGSVRCLREC